MPQADGSLLFNSKLDLAGFEVGVNMVSDLVSGVGEKLKGLASSVLQTGMDFTASMSEVQALSGATGKELEALTETAKEYGASTQFTASESAQALKYMALAGWDTQQMTAGLPGILSLAASSGMELAQASDIVTDYLSAFGMEAEQSAYMADLLSYAQANSNTTVEQLSGAYKNCAANLHAAGQSVETTTALLAMMANQGFKGEEAGTALSAVVRDLSDKMQLADDKMVQSNQSLKGTADYIENLSDLQGQYVITVGNTAIAVSDANGNYRQLTDILKDMERATGSMSEAERTAALQSTLTADSIKGVNVVLNAGVQNAEDFAVALQNSAGTAEDAASTMQDNIKGDLASLSSAFEGLQLNVFEEMKAPIRDVLQTLTESLQDSRTQKAASELGKTLADMAKALANHLPDAISLASDLVKKLWDNKGMIAGIAAVVAAGKGISTVNTAVQGLGTGLSNIVKFAGGSSQALKGISTAMRGLNVFGTLATVVSALATIKAVHEETTRKMYDDIYEVSDAVKKATETAEQNIDDFHEHMQDNQTELLDTDSELERIQELKQKLEELVNSDGTVKAGHEEEVKGILEQINAYAGTSYDVLDGVLTKNGEVITDFKKTSAELDTLIEKQHAQAILSSFEDDYTQALQDQTEKTQELARARKEYNDALLTYNTMQAENDQANAMHMNAPYDATEMAEAKKDLEEHAEAVRTLTQDFNNCTTMIENYEAALEGMKNGDYSQLETLRQMAEEPIQTAETAASIDDLKAQYQDLSGVYEEMLQMKAEGFSIDDDALQATKAKLSAAIIELGKATGVDGGMISGETFMQALQDSTLSASEKVAAIKTFLHDEGSSCADNYALGLAESLASTNNFGMVMNAAQILASSVPSVTRNLWGIHSPSKVARGLSEYWDAGLAEGLLSNADQVQQAAATSANGVIDTTTDLFSDPISLQAESLIPLALDIMNTQGTSAVAAYSPMLQQGYRQAEQTTPPAPVHPQQPQGDIIIPITIGDETIETVVVNAITRANAGSGGVERMITISREPFPFAAYLRVIRIRRDTDETSDGTWATLDDLGTITKVGTDTIVEKNNHDVLVFRKDGTIRIDGNGHPANRNGNGIIEGCSVQCTPQEDGSYLGEDGNIYTKEDAIPGACTDQNGGTFLWNEDVNDKIRVWTIYYDNTLLRNLLQFDVSYAETVNTYENESGQTISYPVRIGKRKIALKVETDLHGLIMLKDYFSQPECFFFFRSTTDIEEQHGTFRKTSDVQIQTVANECNLHNTHLFDDASALCDVNSEYGDYLQQLYEFYKGNDYHTGAYEFSVSLEEV